MMSMHKYSSSIEDQFGESFINFRLLSSENESFEICHITAAVTATFTVTVGFVTAAHACVRASGTPFQGA